jgi:hypothetical protein
VNFVGFRVNKDGIHVDPAKVKAVVEWPVLKLIKEVRAFLGLTGFYRRFIKGYAALAKPLHELIKKEQNFQVWEWPLEAMDAFHQLKDCLVTAPVLASPEPGNEDFLVHSDTSNFAVGAVLSQWQQDLTTGRRQQRVIGFFSRKLTAMECKYATYDRELMAIRDALQSWCFFVQRKHVDIFTDHRALERILKQQTLFSRQFNTLMDLNHFDYDICYIPRVKNVVANRLSRRADHNTSQAALLVTEITDVGHVSEDHVQEDHVQEDHVQEGHVQEDHVQEGHVILDKAVEWLEEVRPAYRMDPFTAVISDLINAEASNGAMARALPASVQKELNAKHSEQRIHHARRQLHRFKFNADGILQSGGRLVVPEGKRLRLRLFEEFHNSKMGGHFGQEKTYLQLSRRFYWPDMEASIRRYVKGCDLCLRTKARQHVPFGLLEGLVIPQERWKQVGIDFITKLPTTLSGNNAIVTIIDHLTKRAHFIPTTEEDLSAEAFARLFLKESVLLHGMPTKIVSDRDPRFVSTFWRQLIVTGLYRT